MTTELKWEGTSHALGAAGVKMEGKRQLNLGNLRKLLQVAAGRCD